MYDLLLTVETQWCVVTVRDEPSCGAGVHLSSRVMNRVPVASEHCSARGQQNSAGETNEISGWSRGMMQHQRCGHAFTMYPGSNLGSFIPFCHWLFFTHFLLAQLTNSMELNLLQKLIIAQKCFFIFFETRKLISVPTRQLHKIIFN
jgi:hypothetical protein